MYALYTMHEPDTVSSSLTVPCTCTVSAPAGLPLSPASPSQLEAKGYVKTARLGTGAFGITYLVEKGSNKFAAKKVRRPVIICPLRVKMRSLIVLFLCSSHGRLAE